MSDINYWIWLAQLDLLGSIRKQKLLEYFKTPENIYKANKEELLKINGIGEKICNNIINNKDRELIWKMQFFMQKNNIKFINIIDEEYPEKLKNIYDPPITLFYKGDISLLKTKCVAVVGSRKASCYGIKIAEKIGKELAQNSHTTVSGLAKGIDTAGHIGAIKSAGKTIAILGTGVDYVYPKENYNLYKTIEKEGLILSEYVVGTKPLATNFPARNRIVTGISDSVIIVEATEKSGALITVDFALEQGKEVFVVPGNIDSEQSKGTNELIRNGALIYTKIDDVL